MKPTIDCLQDRTDMANEVSPRLHEGNRRLVSPPREGSRETRSMTPTSSQQMVFDLTTQFVLHALNYRNLIHCSALPAFVQVIQFPASKCDEKYSAKIRSINRIYHLMR